MRDEIAVVSRMKKHKSCRSVLSDFCKEFSDLHHISLRFPPEYKYQGLKADMSAIKKGLFADAELVDNRELEIHKGLPVRLILTNTFLSSAKRKQQEILLHEFGHYLTNPDLLSIREYIVDKNPELLSIGNATPGMASLVSSQNEAVSFLFQIPKLVQEIHAELWVYLNHPDYSETRLEGYCTTLHAFLKQSRDKAVDKMFLLQMPRINFLILWRQLIIQETDFPFTESCLELVESSAKRLKELAKKAGWDALKLVELREEVADSLRYGNQDIDALTQLYESIFDDFINSCSTLFPSGIQDSVKGFYGTE